MLHHRFLVLVLDTAMLAPVCVLECLDLTGLELHQWLGFALCPLILIHATLQWQWFLTQFQKLLKKGFSGSKNVVLNSLLLVIMSAVLLSGLLASRQVTSRFGESFGNVKVWREIHGWLNFTVFALVGLHLGLNWDWLIAVLRRRGIETAAGAGTTRQSSAPPIRVRPENLLLASGRALGVILAVLLCAALVYFLMGLLIDAPSARTAIQSADGLSFPTNASKTQLIPQPRPVRLAHGVEQLFVTVGLVVLFGLIARHVFRLRL